MLSNTWSVDNYSFSGVDGSLVRDINQMLDTLRETGYTPASEAALADRIIRHYPHVWGIRRYPFSIEKLGKIRPRLVELTLTLDALKEFAYRSDSPGSDERMEYISAVVGKPIERLNAIKEFESEVNRLGVGEDEQAQEGIFKDIRPYERAIRFVGELFVIVAGADVAAHSVFVNNKVRRGEVDDGALNTSIRSNMNYLRQNSGQRIILSREEKNPRKIAELTWDAFMEKYAEMRGVDVPFIEVDGVELAHRVYTCPTDVFKYALSEPVVDSFTEHAQNILNIQGTTKKLCWPELLLGIKSGEQLKTLREVKTDLKRLERKANERTASPNIYG